MNKSYKKNIIYNSIYRLVVIIAPLITSPYISRVLGAENIGVYTYCNAFTLYFVIFSLLGVNDYGNRSIAKNRDDIKDRSHCFWQIYYLQVILSTIALFAYLVAIIFFKNDHLDIRVILITYVVTSFFDINWFAFGLEEFKFTSIRNILFRVGIVICIFLFVKNSNDTPIYTAIMIFGNLLSTIPVWVLVKKHTIFEKPDFKSILSHIKPNLILFLPVIASTIYQQIDKLMLENESLTSDVGYYQNAENIVTLPTFITNAIVTVLLPYISNIVAKGDDGQSIGMLKKTIHYASILNIAMAFGLFSIADLFIPWFLGNGYERSANLVKILVPVIVISGISSIIRYTYLIPNEKDKVFSGSIIVGAIINIILNAIFIPYYAADGAAIATVLSYTSVLIIQVIFSFKVIKYSRIWIMLVPYLMVGFIMLLTINSLETIICMPTIVKLLLLIFCGGIIYILFSIIIMKVTKDEILDTIKNKLFK